MTVAVLDPMSLSDGDLKEQLYSYRYSPTAAVGFHLYTVEQPFHDFVGVRRKRRSLSDKQHSISLIRLAFPALAKHSIMQCSEVVVPAYSGVSFIILGYQDTSSMLCN